MKKLLVLISLIICISMNVYANVPYKHPDLYNYYEKRFQSFSYGPTKYVIDFKEVMTIVKDDNGYMSRQFYNSGGVDVNFAKNCIWVIFRNGTWIILGPGSDVFVKWSLYRQFLINHPQFINTP